LQVREKKGHYDLPGHRGEIQFGGARKKRVQEGRLNRREAASCRNAERKKNREVQPIFSSCALCGEMAGRVNER